jgi:hypothetical protein
MLECQPEQFVCFLARFVFYVHLPNSFTVHPLTCAFPTAQGERWKNMYIVGLQGHEQKCSQTPELEELAAWIKEKLLLWRQGYLLGGWLNEEDGRYCLDPSVAVYGLEDAMKLARSNCQQAIYYPFRSEVIQTVAEAAGQNA